MPVGVILKNSDGDEKLALVAYQAFSTAGVTSVSAVSDEAQVQFGDVPAVTTSSSAADQAVDFVDDGNAFRVDLSAPQPSGAESERIAMQGGIKPGTTRTVTDDFTYLGYWYNVFNPYVPASVGSVLFAPFMVGTPVEDPLILVENWKNSSGDLTYRYSRGTGSDDSFATVSTVSSSNVITKNAGTLEGAKINIYQGVNLKYDAQIELRMNPVGTVSAPAHLQLETSGTPYWNAATGQLMDNLHVSGTLNCYAGISSCGVASFAGKFMGKDADRIGVVFRLTPENEASVYGREVLGTVLLRQP